MNKQEQIAKLAQIISSMQFAGCSPCRISEMSLALALDWNQDIQEAAPEMYALLEELKEVATGAYPEIIEKRLAKARGEQ